MRQLLRIAFLILIASTSWAYRQNKALVIQMPEPSPRALTATDLLLAGAVITFFRRQVKYEDRADH